MHFKFYLVPIAVLINLTYAIKVNIGGTLSLGKEVIRSLSDYLGNTHTLNGRRSMLENEDSITEIVTGNALCRDFQFCLPYRKFVEEYVIVLAKSIQTVLNTVLGGYFKSFVFDEQLKHYVDIIRYVLKHINGKINEKWEVYFWMSAMKRICTKFQEMASIFLSEELKMEPRVINKMKKELNHKAVVATVLVERKYINKLCLEYSICIKSYEVTRSFKTLLEECKKLPDEKVRSFIKSFYEGLFESGFYSYINEVTAHELQIVLNDMAYSGEVSTKEILAAVEDIVQVRIKSIENNQEEDLSYDAVLLHGILSDLDHIYSLHKAEPFASFLQDFFDWTASDIKIDKQIRLVMKDIGKKLWMVSDDLLIKIMNEAKVFLELTVDPEK